MNYRTISLLVVCCFIFSWQPVHADTYDFRTLVRIEVPTKEARAYIRESSIDVVNARQEWVKALLTEEEMTQFRKAGFTITVLSEEMARDRLLWAEADSVKGATSYYTASSFNTVNPPDGSLMKHLLDLHNASPSITRLYDIGDASGGGYDIIAMKVTDNPDSEEAEPEIRIYGNIHGDEKSGLMVATDVLDWILTEYANNNPTAKKLVNDAELWFIPMGNPWGAANSTRYNANGVDLNRNFWGPIGNDDGSPFSEKETQAIRDLTNVMGNRFVNSISFHAGEICFNSVYNYTSAATTDEPIFFSSRTGGPNGGATNAPGGLGYAYQLGCTMPGFWYTNGYDWYQTRGDTNDWSYAIWSDLDTTVEVTSSKTPPVSEIPTYTAQHRQAVINYMMKTFQGISGVMTDLSSGAPLDGTVTVTATQSATIPVPHEYQQVYTDPLVGDYHRVLQPGTYTVECSCEGYQPTTLTGIVVTADTTTVANCQMNGTYLSYESVQLDDRCPAKRAVGDGYLDAGEVATLQLNIANQGVSGATNIDATLSTTSPFITIVDGNATFADVPPGITMPADDPSFTIRLSDFAACGVQIPFTLTIRADEGTFVDTFSLVVGKVTGGTVSVFTDNFEIDRGWSFSSSGEWQRTAPQGLGGNDHGNKDPSSAVSGTTVLGNDLTGLGSGLGDYEDDISQATATSPVINCSNLTNVHVSFQRWLNVEGPSYDQARVEVSTNGSTWSTVWQNANEIADNSWSLQNVDLSAYADSHATVFIRFFLHSDSSYRYAGWTIDDVTVYGDGPVSCTQDPCNPQPVPAVSVLGILMMIIVMSMIIIIMRARRETLLAVKALSCNSNRTTR